MNASWRCWRGFVPVVAGASLVLACTDVADERAERDETVGHYRDSALQIDVDDGLAVVREAKPDHVVFWSSAPTWSATLRGPARELLVLDVYNLVPGSMLRATTDEGVPLEVRVVDEMLPTRRSFAIEAPSATLRVSIEAKETSSSTFRFAVLSDVQRAVKRVQDMFSRIAREPDLDFVLCVGDLTDRGTEVQLSRFESELKTLPIPHYSTLGNHELFGVSAVPYQDVFGRASLHFHHRGTAFSLVDSGSATLSTRTVEWLDDWLDHDRGRVHVFGTHVPPIDPIGVRGGAFASRIEAHQLIARLAEGRVDVAIYGHIHSYYELTNAGVPSYVSGGGGGAPELLDGIGRHYLVVSVSSTGIESVRKVEVDGE